MAEAVIELLKMPIRCDISESSLEEAILMIGYEHGHNFDCVVKTGPRICFLAAKLAATFNAFYGMNMKVLVDHYVEDDSWSVTNQGRTIHNDGL